MLVYQFCVGLIALDKCVFILDGKKAFFFYEVTWSEVTYIDLCKLFLFIKLQVQIQIQKDKVYTPL